MTSQDDSPKIDLAECPCAGGTLDRLIQPAILIALAEESMHGYRIAERIAEFGMFCDAKPDASGVYRFLKTMQSRGLVVASWDTSEHGPARKAYELTPDGKRCLQHWVQTLQEYRCRISALLKTARKVVDR